MVAAAVIAAVATLVVGCEETAQVPQTGSIIVISTPAGARVFFDGSDTGRVTPYTITEVSPGSHTIRLTLDGHADWGPRTVSVAADQVATVDATLTADDDSQPQPQPQHRGLGLERLDVQAYRSSYILRADPVASLPSRLDISRNLAVPRSQGRQGSCVGWAVAFALKTYHERIERGWPLTDANHLMSPAYVYNQIKVDGGGAYFVDAFNLLVNQGVSSWTLMPYDEHDDRTQPSAAARAEAVNYKIANWGTVLRTTHAVFVQEIKRHLVAGDPVIIGIPIYADFDNLSESNPIYDESSGPLRGGHAIVIVGYDNSRSAFKIVNSWGTDWGIGGYGWIDYAASERLIWEAYVTEDIVASSPDQPPAAVSSPSPGNSINNVSVDSVLTWTKNPRTTSFDVYVGTDRDLGAVDFQGNVAQARFSPDLAPGSQYFWRVDARGAGGITKGPVWSFTTEPIRRLPGKPINPQPADGAPGVPLNSELRWDSGGYTTSYDVYFGTSAAPGPSEFQRTQGQRTFSPGKLVSGTRYYWRIDAKNDQGTTRGDLWSFTVGGRQVSLSIADASIPEGNGENENFTITFMPFTVSLSSPSSEVVTVRFSTSDGTATAGEDYSARVDAVLPFSSGETRKTITVPIYSDNSPEPNETFTVMLSSPSSNATISDGTATGTILNDDGSPSLSIADANATEGDSFKIGVSTRNVTFTVTLTPAAAQQVTVSYATANGSATAGSDYTAKSGTLTFAPGETSKTISVAVLDDTADESNETFTVTLSNPSNNATISDATGTGTIIDDCETPPTRPSNPSPSSGTTGVPRRPTLSWSGGDSQCNESVTYDLRIYRSNNQHAFFSKNVSSKSYTLASDLQPNSPYRWNVYVLDNNAHLRGPSTGDWTFTTGDGTTISPPGKASSPNPSHGASGVSASKSLSWTAGSGATKHRVYLGTDSSPDNGEFKGEQSGTSYDPPGNLSANTTYYWRIDEKNDHGTTTGDVWRFTVASEMTKPGKATSPDPSHGATEVIVNKILSWTAGTGATKHRVYFGTDSTPDSGEYKGEQPGTTYDPPGDLADGTYYWRIDEKNTAGTTEGDVWRFTVSPCLSCLPGTKPGKATNPDPFHGASTPSNCSLGVRATGTRPCARCSSALEAREPPMSPVDISLMGY